MDRNSEIFEVTKTINNIKNHDFNVANYRLCKEEADIVMEALNQYIKHLQFDSLTVADIFDRLGHDIKKFDDETKDLQLFDLKN